MKVLHVLGKFPSISTPFVLNQITGMLERGVQINILARYRGDFVNKHEDVDQYNLMDKVFYFENLGLSRRKRLKYFALNIIPSLIKFPLETLKSLNFIKYKRAALSLRLFCEVRGLLKYNLVDFDIIHAQFGTWGVMMQQLKEIGIVKGKLITHFRGYDLERTIKIEGDNYYSLLFKKGDLFLTNCAYFKNYIISKGASPEKIKVQYSGVKTSFFNKTKQEYKLKKVLVLGSVGRLTEKKGYIYIFEALSSLKKNGILFTYEIVGSGELEELLKKLVKDFDIATEVKFWGAQNHTFIKKFLPKLDIFLSHNTTPPSGDMDAPVNTIKEAVLSGVPVISTFHGGIPELIEHEKTGFLTKEKDPEEIYNMILKLKTLYEKDKIEEIAQNAKSFVISTFDNDILNDQLLNTYKKLLTDS
jgi:colanic acid/amylovoran biosynthesis glycosyltransferase